MREDALSPAGLFALTYLDPAPRQHEPAASAMRSRPGQTNGSVAHTLV